MTETTAETFHYRLNGGDEHSITVQTGIYQFAALASSVDLDGRK